MGDHQTQNKSAPKQFPDGPHCGLNSMRMRSCVESNTVFKAFTQFCSQTCSKCQPLPSVMPTAVPQNHSISTAPPSELPTSNEGSSDDEEALQAALDWMPSVTCSVIAEAGMCDYCSLPHSEYLAKVAKPSWAAFNSARDTLPLLKNTSTDVSWSQAYAILHQYATLNRARVLYNYYSYAGTFITSSRKDLKECAPSGLFSELLCREGTGSKQACCTPASPSRSKL